MKKIAIFDMDGTLVDSIDSYVDSINYARMQYGLEKITSDEAKVIFHLSEDELADRLYSNIKECRDLFFKYHKENCTKKIRLYKDIDTLLKELKNKNIMIALATNASDFFAKDMLAKLKIYNYFDLIVGANLVKSPKPDPKMIEYILLNLNANKSEALMIGDSTKDEEVAENSGIDFVFVEWGFGESDTKNRVKKPLEILSYFND